MVLIRVDNLEVYMENNGYKINDSSSSMSKEDRILWLKLKIRDAMDKKNDAEVMHYSRLLSMYQNMNQEDNAFINFLKHKK